MSSAPCRTGFEKRHSFRFALHENKCLRGADMDVSRAETDDESFLLKLDSFRESSMVTNFCQGFVRIGLPSIQQSCIIYTYMFFFLFFFYFFLYFFFFLIFSICISFFFVWYWYFVLFSCIIIMSFFGFLI